MPDAGQLDALFKGGLENLYSIPLISSVEDTLLMLASDRQVRRACPETAEAATGLRRAIAGGDGAARESALIELYLILHGCGASYERAEEGLLAEGEGIGCLPGGILPLVLASRFIRPRMAVVDLGAGNGLQGLLLQRMAPHRFTRQVELSAGLIRSGILYQKVLDLPDVRVEWVHGPIEESCLDDVDVVYLYRPVKPHGDGNRLYQRLAREMAHVRRPLLIVSVADCLSRFLDNTFSTLYENEYLIVIRNEHYIK